MHDFQEQCQVHGQRSKNMASRFASSTQQEIEKLLEDKDSENTKRSAKVAKELFYEYLKGAVSSIFSVTMNSPKTYLFQ